MAKQSAFLARQEARTQAILAEQRRMVIQQCCDMVMIAAHEAFGFGPERLHRLLLAYQDTWDEYATMTLEDAVDMEYTKHRVDEALKSICGDWFQPWEERYSWR